MMILGNTGIGFWKISGWNKYGFWTVYRLIFIDILIILVVWDKRNASTILFYWSVLWLYCKYALTNQFTTLLFFIASSEIWKFWLENFVINFTRVNSKKVVLTPSLYIETAFLCRISIVHHIKIYLYTL